MVKKKVLAAGGPDLISELKGTLLARDTVDLLIAQDGQQAHDMAFWQRPDLVVLELDLPVMAGDECCRRIKEAGGTYVVLIVRDFLPVNLHRCQSAGCDDLVIGLPDAQRINTIATRFLNIAERNAPRIDARLMVRYGAVHQQLLVDYSVNLGTGGLFLETRDPLPLETPLDLEFLLPNSGRKINCCGRVAWVNPPGKPIKENLPPGMGVQFIDLTLEDLDSLRDFVKQKQIVPAW